MRKATWATAIAVLCLLFFVESAYFLDLESPVRRFAGLAWIIVSVGIIFSSWIYAITSLFERDLWRDRDIAWYVAALIVPPAIIYFGVTGIAFTSIDAEGAEQLADGLYLLVNDSCHGVYRIAYTRYAARQFVLNCLPTYFFGPGLLPLRLGNSLFYVGSYLFFVTAFRRWLQHRNYPSPLLLAAYAGTLITLGGYTILNARKFEQTMMPLAATLFFFGALASFLRKPGPLSFVWVTWGFGFFPACYTPALGAWPLALSVLAYYIFFEKRRSLVVPATYGMVTVFVAILIARWEGGLAGKVGLTTDHFTLTDRLLRYVHGLHAFVSSDFSLIPPPLALALIATAVLRWRQRDWRFAYVCVWAFCIAIASLTLVASNLSFPFYDIQRAMIVLAPLAIAATLAAGRSLVLAGGTGVQAGIVRAVLCISSAYMLYTGATLPFSVRNFFSLNYTSDYDEVFYRIAQLDRTPGADPVKRLYLVPPIDMYVEPYVKYFALDAVIVRDKPPPGEKMRGAYVVSFISEKAEDRFFDEIRPSLHPRPFFKIAEE